MDEKQKKVLDQILADFNDIEERAMMELANGSDKFTFTKGPWTVSLDVEGNASDV